MKAFHLGFLALMLANADDKVSSRRIRESEGALPLVEILHASTFPHHSWVSFRTSCYRLMAQEKTQSAYDQSEERKRAGCPLWASCKAGNVLCHETAGASQTPGSKIKVGRFHIMNKRSVAGAYAIDAADRPSKKGPADMWMTRAEFDINDKIKASPNAELCGRYYSAKALRDYFLQPGQVGGFVAYQDIELISGVIQGMDNWVDVYMKDKEDKKFEEEMICWTFSYVATRLMNADKDSVCSAGWDGIETVQKMVNDDTLVPAQIHACVEPGENTVSWDDIEAAKSGFTVIDERLGYYTDGKTPQTLDCGYVTVKDTGGAFAPYREDSGGSLDGVNQGRRGDGELDSGISLEADVVRSLSDLKKAMVDMDEALTA